MRRAERRGLVLAFAVLGVFWGAWAATLPAIQRQAGLSDGELGLALAALAVGAVPVMPLAGRRVDKVGAARALPVTLLGFAAVIPLTAFVHSLPGLVLSALLLGLASGALDVVANAATAAWERLEQSAAMSLVHGAFSVGVLVGATSAGLARQHGAAVVAILGTAAVLSALAGVTQPHYRRDPGGEQQVRQSRLPSALLALGALTAVAFLCEDAIQSWSALRLERGLGASPAVAGLGPGLFAGAMAVGRLGGAALAGRGSPRSTFRVAASLLALGALVVALASTPAVALAGLVIAGAGTSVLVPVLYSAVGAAAAPGRQGADLAAVSMLGYVGFVAGPPLVGVISAAVSLPFAFGCLAACGVMLALVGPRGLSVRMRA